MDRLSGEQPLPPLQSDYCALMAAAIRVRALVLEDPVNPLSRPVAAGGEGPGPPSI